MQFTKEKTCSPGLDWDECYLAKGMVEMVVSSCILGAATPFLIRWIVFEVLIQRELTLVPPTSPKSWVPPSPTLFHRSPQAPNPYSKGKREGAWVPVPHLTTVRSWGSYLTSLNPSFLGCKLLSMAEPTRGVNELWSPTHALWESEH